jgi:drug/metabolite transporter (DMT)-like permease
MSTADGTVPPPAGFAAAVGLLVAGLLTASLSGAMLKMMSGELNVAMITAGRYTGYLAVLLPVAAWRYGFQVVRPPQWQAQFIRAALILGATLTFVMSVIYLPLATAVAILYIYPFIVAALSPFMLGERGSAATWAGIALGFVGIIVVMRPDLGALNAGAIAALATGGFYALHIIFTRKVANSGPALVSNTFMAIVALALILPFAIWWWQPLNGRQSAILLFMGGINAVSHLLIINAFMRASAPSLAPFSYAELVGASVLGFAFFGDLPDVITVIGMLIIVGSGIMVSQSGNLGRLFARRRAPSGGG